MPTQYTITYTYRGQANTRARREVALSKFTATGDGVGMVVRQVVSITYRHSHSTKSANANNMNLRGRLVFSDGTSVTSNTVNRSYSGVTTWTNTFATLPTAAQLALLTKVQTLDQAGAVANGSSVKNTDIYWRADNSDPMVLTVQFYGDPPVHYAPSIERFDVGRCLADGTMNDEGVYIKTTVKLNVGNTESGWSDNASVRVYYAADRAATQTDSYIDLTSRLTQLITGVEFDQTLIPSTFQGGNVWHFLLVFKLGDDETALAADSVGRTYAPMFISGVDGGKRISFGGLPRAAANTESFEVYMPAHFYGGIEGVCDYSTDETDTGGRWIDGKPIYRRVYTAPSSTGTNTMDYNCYVMETPVKLYGFAQKGGAWYPLNWTQSSASDRIAVFIQTDKRIRVQSGGGTLTQCIVIIEYTKSP